MINNTSNGLQADIIQPVFDGMPIMSASLFWRAHYLKHSPTFEALPLIFWLVENLRPRTSVVLGMDDPVLYFALCQAVAKLDDDNLCMGIDLLPKERIESEDAVGHREIFDYNDAHYPEFSQIVSGDHVEIAGQFSDSSIDTLVVGCFASHALQDEIDKYWLPRMSARGVVLFLAGGDNLGNYISRVSRDGESFVLDTAQRVRLALHGDQHGERLQKLCRLRIGRPGYLAVRNVFMRIGEAHRNSALIEEMNCACTTKAAAPERPQWNPASTVELKQNAMKLAEVRTALEESRNRAEETERLLMERFTDIGELGCELKKRESRIAEVQTELEESKRYANASKQMMTELQATLDIQQRDMKDLDDCLEAVKHERDVAQQRLVEIGHERDLVSDRVAAVEQERDETNRLIAGVEHERNETNRLFEQILHSTSWRVTKPLRKIAHVVLRKEPPFD